MQTRYEHNGLVWVDLESPSRDEAQDIVERFGIAPAVAQDLLLPSSKSRAELYPSFIYLVMHFPALRHSHRTREQEIDFIIGKNFLITTRYDTIDPLHKFSKVFEVNSLLDKSAMGEHAGHLFFAVLKKLYKSVEHEVEFVRHDISVIEEHIFEGHEVQMVTAISRVARDLLNLLQVIESHRDLLKQLESDGARFFGGEFAPYLRALSDEYYRVHNHITRNKEFVNELRETNDSLLTTKQNETMRTLTIMALLTFPLSLLVAVLGLNTPHNPLHALPYEFWLVLGSVVFAGLCMILYFKHKNWL